MNHLWNICPDNLEACRLDKNTVFSTDSFSNFLQSYGDAIKSPEMFHKYFYVSLDFVNNHLFNGKVIYVFIKHFVFWQRIIRISSQLRHQLLCHHLFTIKLQTMLLNKNQLFLKYFFLILIEIKLKFFFKFIEARVG